MQEDFDRLPDRNGTGALKWDRRTPEEKRRGIVPLSVADMEFACARPIQEAVRRAAEHGLYGYTDPDERYFDAVTGWMLRRHGLRVRSEEIVCENGVIPALSTALRALTRAGEGVIYFTPVYYPFWQVVSLNDRRAEECPLQKGGDGSYQMDFDRLEDLARKRDVTALLLCSPHNPVGRVWTREELARVVDICRRHGVVLLSDEIHFDIVLEGEHTVLPRALDGAAEITVLCTSPSKTFNLAGLRLANIIIQNPDLRTSYKRRQAADGNSNIAYFGRAAIIAAYEDCAPWVDELCAYLRGNLSLMESFFAQRFPGVTLTKTQGTYFAWADFSAWGLADDALSGFLRQDAELVLDDGTMFGASGSGCARFNVALPRAELQKALDRLDAAAKRAGL
jgi:cystathionine beta-lyase